MINRPEIKAEAKEILRGARVNPYIITLMVIAIGFVLERIVDLVQGGSLFYTYEFARQCYALAASGNIEGLERLLLSAPESTAASFFLSTLVSLVTLVLNGGYYIYCMGVRQGQEMPYSSLADGLGAAGRLIWCWIQISVRVFLWSMLLVIPGIIAVYRYRFAYYNILTDDSLSAGDAIRLSCQQTQGMKMDLFVLDLSFLGWQMLASLTAGLLNIWLIPYMTMCDLAFFEEAQRRMGRSPYGGGRQTPPQAGDPWGEV